MYIILLNNFTTFEKTKIMNNCLKGILIKKGEFGWQVRYEFGKSQVKYIILHADSIQGANEFGIEGEEVDFVIRGSYAPHTLNGVISSALIAYKKKPN
jgi:hypothetical protein